MKTQAMDLAWIVVDDLEKAIQFYTQTIGLKLVQKTDEYGWAELIGHEGGARIGLAKSQGKEKAGTNATLTFVVANLEEALQELQAKKARLEGGVLEIPGHVKMQTVIDADGNQLQIVQKLHS